MEQIKIIALKESVLADNNADAQALREELQSVPGQRKNHDPSRTEPRF